MFGISGDDDEQPASKSAVNHLLASFHSKRQLLEDIQSKMMAMAMSSMRTW